MKNLVDKEDLVFSPPELGGVLSLSGLPGGGSKIYDRSPYGNAGAITGATWVRLPSGLWCLSFDGIDDYVDCGASSSLAPPDITVELWLNTTDTSDVYKTILFTGTRSALQGVYLFRDGGGDTVGFGVWGKGVAYIPNFAESLATDGAWHHLVGVKSGDNLDVYLDSVSKDPKTLASINITANSCYIGARTDAQQNFTGYIALPRIHSRALSALEIQRHFEREKHLFGVW